MSAAEAAGGADDGEGGSSRPAKKVRPPNMFRTNSAHPAPRPQILEIQGRPELWGTFMDALALWAAIQARQFVFTRLFPPQPPRFFIARGFLG